MLDDPDHRVRANLVEAFWPLQYSGAQELYLKAAADSHHRVAANAMLGSTLSRRTGDATGSLHRRTPHRQLPRRCRMDHPQDR
jgi:hypothetical protein